MDTENTRHADEFTLPSFAKINLILRVLGLLPDGYHSLFTVFQALELHDLITFRFEPSDHLEIDLELDDPAIPFDNRNLIYRALAGFDQAHAVASRIHVRVQKRIPAESGLGGGSSNAAVALMAVSRHLNWPLTPAQLSPIASRLGADVPFFLSGGTAIGRGKGDEIEQIEDSPAYEVLLVRPAVSCSTAVIYKKYDELVSLTGSTNSIKIISDQRLETQRDFVPSIGNDLEKVVFTLYPELDSIKKRLLGSGAAAAALSGSGSALFGLFAGAGDLEKAAREFPATTQTRFVSRSEYEKRLKIKDKR